MIRLSKEISYLLRHTTLPQSDPHGWVPIPLLQQHLRYPVSYEEIKHVVDNNDKVKSCEMSKRTCLRGCFAETICAG